MLVVVALGGNALLRRGEPANLATQRANVATAVDAVVELAREHDVVVTHGNGPQVGLLALQGEAYAAVDPYPLDVLGAESDGMIGYLLDEALVNRLAGSRQVATLLTQLIVERDDPAFARPQKFIGPVVAPAVLRPRLDGSEGGRRLSLRRAHRRPRRHRRARRRRGDPARRARDPRARGVRTRSAGFPHRVSDFLGRPRGPLGDAMAAVINHRSQRS
jgi:carbamate kinase